MKLTRWKSLAAGVTAAALCVAIALAPVPGLKPGEGFDATAAGMQRRGISVRLEYASIPVAQWVLLRARVGLGVAGEGARRRLRPLLFVGVPYADAFSLGGVGVTVLALWWHLRKQRRWELRSLSRIEDVLRGSEPQAERR